MSSMKNLLLAALLVVIALPCAAQCPSGGPDPLGIGRPPVIELIALYGFSDNSFAFLLRNTCRDTGEVIWWRWFFFGCPTGDCEAARFPETAPWFFLPDRGRPVWWQFEVTREGGIGH
jgi:hypothetical protein